jgi:hypothetical protein
VINRGPWDEAKALPLADDALEIVWRGFGLW